MSFVTVDNFDETKLTTGEIYVAQKPVQYQKIPIRYIYPKGTGPLLIRTPTMTSFGVCEIKDITTGELNGYSTSFLCFDENEGKTAQDEKFIAMMETITEFCKKALRDRAAEVRKNNKKRPVSGEGLTILRYKEERPGSAPVIYAKMLTSRDSSKTIQTPFFRKKTNKDIRNCVKIINGKLVKDSPYDYIKQRCRIIGCIKVENIFIGQVESIQVNLTEAVIVNKIKSMQSVMGPDLDLGPSDESSSDDEDEPPRTKKEIVARRPKPVLERDSSSEEGSEDEEDTVMDSLKGVVQNV